MLETETCIIELNIPAELMSFRSAEGLSS